MIRRWAWVIGPLLLVAAGGLGLVLVGCRKKAQDGLTPGGPQVRFTDVTEAWGLRFTHFNGVTSRKLLPETMGSGVAVIDFDRDGRPDLFFVNSRAWPGHPAPTNR